jgi:hypothetical protein
MSIYELVIYQWNFQSNPFGRPHFNISISCIYIM